MDQPMLWFSTGALAPSLAILLHAVTGRMLAAELGDPVREFRAHDEGCGCRGPTMAPASSPKAVKRLPILGPRADAGEGSGVSGGIASFYEVRTNGSITASDVPLKDSVSTAAHRTLPFGTLVRVTNLANGLSETLAITDQGPYFKGRIIDVSRSAAEKLGMIRSGITPVEIEILPGRRAPRNPSRAGE